MEIGETIGKKSKNAREKRASKKRKRRKRKRGREMGEEEARDEQERRRGSFFYARVQFKRSQNANVNVTVA